MFTQPTAALETVIRDKKQTEIEEQDIQKHTYILLFCFFAGGFKSLFWRVSDIGIELAWQPPLREQVVMVTDHGRLTLACWMVNKDQAPLSNQWKWRWRRTQESPGRGWRTAFPATALSMTPPHCCSSVMVNLFLYTYIAWHPAFVPPPCTGV